MSANPFGALAEGYASSRPPVHPQVLNKVRAVLGRTFDCALDVGCGSGLSTRPLTRLAGRAVGLDPAVSMVQLAAGVAPTARFVAAAAEVLPFRDRSFDLITAAGSLNYADTGRFFPEARRVLTPAGWLVVYDFSPGREFPASAALEGWFAEFERRYPWPAAEGRVLTPATLAQEATGFELVHEEPFAIPLTLTAEFYVNYMMTETNVAYALRRGEPEAAIRGWCTETLAAVFEGQPRDVVFRGYFAGFRAPAG